jgi:hypothetical protein
MVINRRIDTSHGLYLYVIKYMYLLLVTTPTNSMQKALFHFCNFDKLLSTCFFISLYINDFKMRHSHSFSYFIVIYK